MADGVKTQLSRYGFEETVERLESVLKEKGVKLFSVIDHSGEARAAGLEMPATRVLIFGSPKAGTPVILAAPSVALDLPLKVLVARRRPARSLSRGTMRPGSSSGTVFPQR